MHTASNSRVRPGRFRGLLGAALLALAGLLLVGAPAAAAAPSPYRHDVSRVSSHLRIAIEIRPAQLGEYLRSSELTCGLGDRAEGRGDSASAGEDWGTLNQFVSQLDLPESRAIDSAFARADSNLEVLRDRYSRAWKSQPQRVGELRRGVGATRDGIETLRGAMNRISAAYARWEARDCRGAITGIEAGVRRLEPGLIRVNAGMNRLWRLSVA